MDDIEVLEGIVKEYNRVSKEWKFGNVPIHIDEQDIEVIKNVIKKLKNL